MKLYETLLPSLFVYATMALSTNALAQGVAASALVQAARDGRAEVVASMLKRGVDPDARHEHGRTALMEAARNGHYETVRTLLIHGAHKDLTDDAGRTAFDLAVEKKKSDVIALLRDAS